MDWPEFVHSGIPAILAGKAVIGGTRIPVDLILEKLGAGETVDDVLAAHPRLTREAIQAPLAFAAESLRGDVVFLVPPEAA